MELLGGLSFLGHIMNNRDENKPEKQKKVRRPNIPGNNVYDNDSYKKSLRKMKAIAKRRNKMARNPDKSGVIPPYYNSNRSFIKKKFDPFDEEHNEDSEFSDMEKYDGKSCDAGTVNLGDPLCFYKQQEKFKNTVNTNIVEGFNSGKNTFLNQFDALTVDNAGAPVASNSINTIVGDDGTKRLELERSMALHEGFSNFNADQDQTYGIVSKDAFVHNNMQPFFNSKDGGFNAYSERKSAELNQRRLDTYSGSANNLDYRPRTERKRLFDPVAGLTNMYGSPVLTNFMDARFIPGMERRNEKPFQEDRVTPGLNLGYNEVSKAGFQDTFRVLPKTVDQLRVASKPKTTFGGVVIPGMKGQRSSIPSKMYKRKPLTFWEQTPSDYIRGQSYIKGPTIHAEVDYNNLATVNRGVVTNGRLGGPKLFTDLHTPETLIEKTKVSLKENFKNDTPRNAHNAELNKGYAKDGVNWIQDPTMRDVHDKTERAGQMGNNQFNKGYIYDGVNWIQDPTMRDVHDKTDRAGQVGNAELDKGYYFDGVNWIQDPTMRDLHDKKDRVGLVGNPEIDKGYYFDGVNWIQDPTMRDIHDKKDRAGQVGNPEIDKGYVYDGVNWIPDPNMRNIHDKKDRAGQVGNKQFNKGYVYDGVNWIQDPTMRDIHDRTERVGQMGNKQLDKGYIYDGVNWVPDPTMRDVHDRTERAGQMGNGELDKPFVFDMVNNIQDPTMRNIHDRYDRAGQMGNGELDKPFVFDMINNIQDPTMRDIHGHRDRAGVIGSNEKEKQRSRGDANNMRVNTEKEVIASGRQPTNSGYSKGPTVSFTMMNLREPLNYNRDIYPDIQQTTTQKFGFIGTRSKQTLPQQGFRFFSFVDENLMGNPLVNNVIHQSQQ